MFGLEKIQIYANKLIAKENKKYILKKLEEYYEAVNYAEKIKAKEYAIYAFWKAKKQGRLDNLNRLTKKTTINRNHCL